jgi:hypothetical protein
MRRAAVAYSRGLPCRYGATAAPPPPLGEGPLWDHRLLVNNHRVGYLDYALVVGIKAVSGCECVKHSPPRLTSPLWRHS